MKVWSYGKVEFFFYLCCKMRGSKHWHLHYWTMQYVTLSGSDARPKQFPLKGTSIVKQSNTILHALLFLWCTQDSVFGRIHFVFVVVMRWMLQWGWGFKLYYLNVLTHKSLHLCDMSGKRRERKDISAGIICAQDSYIKCMTDIFSDEWRRVAQCKLIDYHILNTVSLVFCLLFYCRVVKVNTLIVRTLVNSAHFNKIRKRCHGWTTAIMLKTSRFSTVRARKTKIVIVLTLCYNSSTVCQASQFM